MKAIKQAVSLLLILCLVFGIVPASAAETEDTSPTAEEPSSQAVGLEYVALPITIRDFAFDGMFFNWNETNYPIGATHTRGAMKYLQYYSSNDQPWIPASGDGSGNGVRVTNNSYTGWASTDNLDKNFLAIYCDGQGEGKILNVAPVGTNKQIMNGTDLAANPYNWSLNMDAAGNDGWTIWVRETDPHYDYLSCITQENKSDWYVSLDTSQGTLRVFNRFRVVDYYGMSDYVELWDYKVVGDNKPFGMVNSTESNAPFDIGLFGGTLVGNDAAGIATVLNSGAKQTIYGALVNTNLVTGTLDPETGSPVYTQKAVEAAAMLLQSTLNHQMVEAGYFQLDYVIGVELFDANYNYVGPRSASAKHDLADVLRHYITEGLGNYEQTLAKNLTSFDQCRTYTDAAWLMMHSFYLDVPGYGQTVNEYKTLQLQRKGDRYVFDSAYDGVVYDTKNQTIYNSQTEKKTFSQVNGQTHVHYGNPIPAVPFNPVGAVGKDAYYGSHIHIYNMLMHDYHSQNEELLYKKYNYNYTLEGHGEFVFHSDDNLFFTFTGDDDVYLYINGVRVLDLGGAHPISRVSINLNDSIELCGLKDGETATFDFFYMERHGTAANLGIETNIEFASPEMNTTKQAFQNNSQLDYGAAIDQSKPVYYQFMLENKGTGTLTNLTFHDPKIGVTLSQDSIVLNRETEDVHNLMVNKRDASGNWTTHTNLDENTLKAFLRNGLHAGEALAIYGFSYTIPATSFEDGKTFTNTVYTTAYSESNGQTLHGTSSFRVAKTNYQVENLRHYSWLHQDADLSGWKSQSSSASVTATKDEVIEVLNTALGRANMTTVDPSQATVQLCAANGSTQSHAAINKNVTADSNGFTHTAKTTGQDSYYVKVTANGMDYTPIRIVVFTYGVTDDAYVLDFGLPVSLYGDSNGIQNNDVLVLQQNRNRMNISFSRENTSAAYGSFGGGNNSLTYTPNRIINGVETVDVIIEVVEPGQAVSKTSGVRMTQKLTLIPASNVYYEESFLKQTDWQVLGTADSRNQSSTNVLYGFDNAYQGFEENSLNVCYGATVSDPLVQPKATFTFTGTGFDIISRTTPDSGVMVVKVFRPGETKTQRLFLVDTWLGNDSLYQLPVVHCTGLDYGTYTVEIIAYYNRAFDHKLTSAAARRSSTRDILAHLGCPANTQVEYITYNSTLATGGIRVAANARSLPATQAGQYNVYLDGVRIYQPLTASPDNSTARDAYHQAGEFQASYTAVRQILLDAASWAGSGATGVLYLANGETAEFGEGILTSGIYLSSSGKLATEDVGGKSYLIDEDHKRLQFEGQDVWALKDNDGKMGYYAGDTRLTEGQVKALKLYYYDDLYRSMGPKNEAYLKNGNGIAFAVSSGSTVHISAKSPNGQPVTLCVWNGSAWVEAAVITSATEMYYDISDYISGSDVIVKCLSGSDSGILSLCNIKVGGELTVTVSAPLMLAALDAMDSSSLVHTAFQQEVTQPTCTQKGYTTHICLSCGERSVDTYTDALGHCYEAVLTPPTTASQGYTTHTCALCGDRYVDSYTDPLPLSADSTLSSLTVGNAAISPAFHCDTVEYTAQVPFGVDKLELHAQAAYGKAKVEISNPSLVPGGITPVTVTVTAENGTQRVYTISVTRAQAPEPDENISNVPEPDDNVSQVPDDVEAKPQPGQQTDPAGSAEAEAGQPPQEAPAGTGWWLTALGCLTGLALAVGILALLVRRKRSQE